ncbi:glycosyl hydrolase [Pedobacter rhizosphaerae]|uniref:Glycosyl hydrolases family 2, sugar binding domain n=1 Tax=Pedobacter rhizosphaerae TaxID=390241 RepID=A0A1H9QJE3_9SPHI|nr:glycosyl hydrolase [Pedobacter rhizosphaerae]SER60582.1 Glycosyl hydrolases family 2, sugar binding domain [Pedobacter rhizosphaerae]
MKTKLFLPALLFGMAILNQVDAQSPAKKNTSSWPVIERQMKPWTRWWWMGNAVDEQNLNDVLQKYSAAGLGGVEITPIYGAVGFEKKYIQFLSPEWMNMVRFTVNKANSLGLGVDMNTGTGWPFGGPQIKPENAASKLITQKYSLKAGEKLTERIQVKEAKQEFAELQALTAYSAGGETLNLLKLVQADGTLNWSPASGNWDIYALFSGKTRQLVKRAAPGGEGFTLDHLDRKSTDVYLKRFTDAFGNQAPGVRSFFNDSYEVYGATWTPTFLEAFKQNRGYDLSNYIKELVSKDSADENVARLKSDYRETMDELLLKNFTQNWTNWAHQQKALTKNQSHGSPGNLLDLYGAVDIPETEIFGSSYFPIPGIRRDSADVRNVDPDPIMSRFASSAAHTGGKKLASSETFTWLTEHFKTSYSQCKPEAEKLFLSGINHIFYHGTTHSPSQVPWPGWLFYASVEMNPNNSLWPHANGLNNYIARCQSILQTGTSDNEILLYWPVYDVWNKAKGLDMPLKVHDVDEWLHPSAFYKLAKQLDKVGYAFDFASDRLLQQTTVKDKTLITAAKAAPYQTLVIPKCELMNPETLEKVINMAAEGANVIFQDLPKDVPGRSNLQVRREKLKTALSKINFSPAVDGISQFKIGKGQIFLAADVQKALLLNGLKREELTDIGLQVIRRKTEKGKYYYLVNHTSKDIDAFIPINEKGRVEILNPQDGLTGMANVKDNKVRLQLKSGESLFLLVSNVPASATRNWTYLDMPGKEIALTNPWNLHFTAGGPELPADQKLNKLVSWTTLNDPKLQAFSGTGVYTSNFNLPNKKAKEYLLQLNQVDESARVWINGQEVGILWSIPFEARIGKYLKAGNNTIKIEVVNLMANRIRDLDVKKVQWRKYHEINFVNINYREFDASNWSVMPSGLIGPVVIKPYL